MQKQLIKSALTCFYYKRLNLEGKCRKMLVLEDHFAKTTILRLRNYREPSVWIDFFCWGCPKFKLNWRAKYEDKGLEIPIRSSNYPWKDWFQSFVHRKMDQKSFGPQLEICTWYKWAVLPKLCPFWTFLSPTCEIKLSIAWHFWSNWPKLARFSSFLAKKTFAKFLDRIHKIVCDKSKSCWNSSVKFIKICQLRGGMWIFEQKFLRWNWKKSLIWIFLCGFLKRLLFTFITLYCICWFFWVILFLWENYLLRLLLEESNK